MMKKRILYLMLCASLYNTVMGQVPASCLANSNDPTKNYCKDGHGISTNPNNLINDDCPDLKNDFEWRVKHSPNLIRPAEEKFVIVKGNDIIEPRNPFNADDPLLDYAYMANNHNSNYHPEDGWELLKMDFGMLSNIGLPHSANPGRNVDVDAPKLPYFILYNKYSGTFRFFGTLLKPADNYHTIKIELRIPKRSPNSSGDDNFYNDQLKATNLLSISGETVQPLDEETDESVMVVFASSPNNEEAFFWFDIPVAYDPCVCNFKSQLDITFEWIQTADIKLEGVFEGEIKNITDPLTGPQYAKKLTFGTMAAALSTFTGVATGGAVVNFKAYSELVATLAKNPNLSQDEKDKLKKLAGYAKCGADFAHVLRDNLSSIGSDDVKKAVSAGNKVLDGTVAFLSSLGNGCQEDNGSTVVSGTISLNGMWTVKNTIDLTSITMAVPGSDWSDKVMSITSYKGSDNKLIPAYPTYNERLGTFALLETPTIAAFEAPRMDHSVLRLALSTDLKYAFNPKMNIDRENTKIYCRLVSRDNSFIFPDLPRFSVPRINMLHSILNRTV